MPDLKLDCLDKTVLKALDFFTANPPKSLNLSRFKFPLVIGSVNSYNTAKLIFTDQAAFFANESNLKKIIRNEVPLIMEKKMASEIIVISASGEKDSVWELKLAKKYGLKTILFTCSPQSTAAKIADEVFVFHKLPEPYTYNVSTYLGMILSVFGENPSLIKKSLVRLSAALPKNFQNYHSYAFIIPDEHAALSLMIRTKQDELFGPKVSIRAFSYSEARHAKFVIRDPKELIISFEKNEYFGNPKSRWEIKLPGHAGAGLLMCLSYYLIGLIQADRPAYFKKHIANYCLDYGYKAYGRDKPFEVIVPGN
jgi:hypothetical protein